MRSSTFVLAATASVVSAVGPPSGDTHYSCAKANANYCLGGDIILRCDGKADGVPGRCSDNLAGYPPAGGVASCWQSSEEAGDAACAKNCVVHASETFTLDNCQPTSSPTSTHPYSNTTITTITATQTTTYCSEGCSHTTPPPPPPPDSTTIIVPPPGNGTVVPPPGNGTVVPPPGSQTPPSPGATTSGAQTVPPAPLPSAPSPSPPPPSAGSLASKASTLLAAIGIVAAYLV